MRNQKGQVLLIVVLIMVITLTVGLALASRSIINVNNTNEEANSQKAFQAAEAGIEIGLQQPMSSVSTSIGAKSAFAFNNTTGATINGIAITPLVGSTLVLNNGNPISQDNGIDVWLTDYPDYSGSPWGGNSGANMNIYWGANAGCNDAALEVVVISGASSTDTNATINRYGIDPCGTNSIDASKNRTGSNNFSPASGGATIAGISFKFGTSITVKNGLLARIIPLYANTPIVITGTSGGNPVNFPLQGRTIVSSGTFGSTQRKISFFQTFPQIPIEYYYSVMQP